MRVVAMASAKVTADRMAVSCRAAEVLPAEIGRDMSRSPNAKCLTSLAKPCPGRYESRDTCKGGKTREGSHWLRQLFIEAAHGTPIASGGIAAHYAAGWRPSGGRRRHWSRWDTRS
jgi:transposase